MQPVIIAGKTATFTCGDGAESVFLCAELQVDNSSRMPDVSVVVLCLVGWTWTLTNSTGRPSPSFFNDDIFLCCSQLLRQSVPRQRSSDKNSSVADGCVKGVCNDCFGCIVLTAKQVRLKIMLQPRHAPDAFPAADYSMHRLQHVHTTELVHAVCAMNEKKLPDRYKSRPKHTKWSKK